MHDSKHFWLSVLAMCGGTFVAIQQPELQQFATSAVTLIVGYWFGAKAGNGHGKGNGV